MIRNAVELRWSHEGRLVATEASEGFGATGTGAAAGVSTTLSFWSRILRGGSPAPSQGGWRCVWVGEEFDIKSFSVSMTISTPALVAQQLEQLHREA